MSDHTAFGAVWSTLQAEKNLCPAGEGKKKDKEEVDLGRFFINSSLNTDGALRSLVNSPPGLEEHLLHFAILFKV